MKQQFFRAVVAASVLLALPLIATAAGLTPGLYEYTMTMDMPAAAGESARPQVKQECITEAGLGSIDRLAPMPKDGNCQILDKRDSGGQFSYKFSCTGPLKSEGTVSGSATGIAVTTTMAMGNGQTMKTSMTGRRIGDCK